MTCDRHPAAPSCGDVCQECVREAVRWLKSESQWEGGPVTDEAKTALAIVSQWRSLRAASAEAEALIARLERDRDGWERDYNELIYSLRKQLGGAPADEGIDYTANRVMSAPAAAKKRIAELEGVSERSV